MQLPWHTPRCGSSLMHAGRAARLAAWGTALLHQRRATSDFTLRSQLEHNVAPRAAGVVAPTPSDAFPVAARSHKTNGGLGVRNIYNAGSEAYFESGRLRSGDDMAVVKGERRGPADMPLPEGVHRLDHGLDPAAREFVDETDEMERLMAGVTHPAASPLVMEEEGTATQPQGRKRVLLSMPPLSRTREAAFQNGRAGAEAAAAQHALRTREVQDADPTARHRTLAAVSALGAEAERGAAVERRMMEALESGATVQLKADVLVRCAEALIEHKWPVRARIVGETFQVLLAAAEEAADEAVCTSGPADASTAHELGGGGEQAGSTPLPPQPATARVEFPYLDIMTRLYFHLRATHTAPDPPTLEHFMAALHWAGGGARNDSVMHLATRLLLDADRFTVLPSRATYSAYFDVCADNGQMDIALVRMADVKNRLFIAPDSGMVRAVAAGLIKNGLIPEAVGFVGRIAAEEAGNVAVDIQLFNTVLEALMLSQQPQSVLAAYRAVSGVGIRPTSDTFYIILASCQRAGIWGPGVRLVLQEMQRLGVRGDPDTLNLLLKGLLLAGDMGPYAQQLHAAMTRRGVEIWDEVAAAVPWKALSPPPVPPHHAKRTRFADDADDIATAGVTRTPPQQEQKQLAGRGWRRRLSGLPRPKHDDEFKAFAARSRLGDVHPEALAIFAHRHKMKMTQALKHMPDDVAESVRNGGAVPAEVACMPPVRRALVEAVQRHFYKAANPAARLLQYTTPRQKTHRRDNRNGNTARPL